ncbi:hypothetical protein [Mycobacterium phage WXIN]|nr:hypothetical protein [Mycobacterium phage WXIN]
MSDEHNEECTCGGIPEGAIVTNVLTIVEYMDTDGEIWKSDFSHDSAGNELPLGKMLELCSWGQMIAQAPVLADLVHGYLQSDED